MIELKDKISTADIWLQPLRSFYFRSLICFAVVGTLASFANWPKIQPAIAGIIIFALAYLALSFHLSKRKNATPLTLERYLGWIDAALIGSCISLVGFQILPTILFVTILQFNAVLMGGGRKWLEDNCALITAATAASFFSTPVWVLSGSIEISAASLIGVSVYIVLYGLYIHFRIKKMEEESELLSKEREKYKFKAFRLAQYLPPTVWHAISKDNDQKLQTERKRLTVFFSDIQGFTSLSEELESETLTGLLNTYLTEMAKIVTHFGGTIDKFMGDGIMVIFGDNKSQGAKQDCIACTAMALAMRRRMKVLQNHWFNQGIKKPLQIRMGINTGFCTIGTFGARAHHLDYTALGPHVNLASRLESAAKPGEILVSHEVWALIKDTILCENKGMIEAKGFSYPIEVYQVIDHRKNLGKNQVYFESSAEGFSMHLDLEKVRNYDKARVIEELEKATNTLKDKVIL
ncbi:adenylate/guanylate cyclase domain-containing protein [Marinibactrum halimedae]|uniref:Protein CyaB n=1 Tax=Marinibactrum halimedae TaxID=1444977 RepID=A0AA37WNN7_9GAMM|nr:adenylate/guanylate cyclase domain-containing protein [Marinibactrum halimedae]MCD9457863.1 adenylate/guanylate cyclase domain-containing protein [Marinibactrum halimedae]GLS26316.1 protein CyaB [Marinibactrum halimedae]